MKKYFIIISAFFLLISCSNNDDASFEKDKLVTVNFKVKSLDFSVEPMVKSSNLRSSQSSSILEKIEYAFYNQTTGQHFEGSQSLVSSDDEFGNISINLPSGTYYYVFFGTGKENNNGTANISVANTIASSDTYYIMNNKDVFDSFSNLTISPTNTEFDINLNRINGKLVVRIDDNVPAEVKKVKISFGIYTKYKPLTHDISASTMIEDYLSINNGNVEEFGFYTFPASGTDVHLSILGDNDILLDAFSIPVSIYINKKTIIQGNVFQGIGKNDFTVTVSDDWDEDVIVPIE